MSLVKSCLDDLERTWKQGEVVHEPYSDEPLDGLILTILSQNTNDRNRDRAFASLKAHFNTWGEVSAASAQEISNVIRSGGLSNIKARRILEVLERVRSHFGNLSLKALRGWETEDIRRFLEGTPGVGAKTIACVLLFDLGRPAFPVDTHIARVSRRLGWAEASMPPEEIQVLMEDLVPPERYNEAHLNLITHGRRLCTSRKAFCVECPLRDRCPYPERIPEG
ncbi:MAG TPA: endonuclease III [Thermovirgaceae bacterium]|nr:endonuclease III [Thermovirgaceae bacterium]